MPAYSSSTCRSSQEVEEIQRMWTQQAVSDTELYGSHGEILSCENITKVFNETEINQIASMLSNDEHWRHQSSNCNYLLTYSPGKYNNNLDKVMRCSAKCDPDNQLPSPFPMFTEEEAHLNQEMNYTISRYIQCLQDVGISNKQILSNLTEARHEDIEVIKKSTCASLKEFTRKCSPLIRRCLQSQYAERILAIDFHRLVNYIYHGLVNPMWEGFNVTSCDIFGGEIYGIVS